MSGHLQGPPQETAPDRPFCIPPPVWAAGAADGPTGGYVRGARVPRLVGVLLSLSNLTNGWPACMNMHRRRARRSSAIAADRVFRTAMALAPLSDVNAGRVCHLDGEADRRSRRKGRAAGTQARTIQLPQGPSAWIRAGDRHQPWIIGVPPHPGSRPCRGNAVAEPSPTAQR